MKKYILLTLIITPLKVYAFSIPSAPSSPSGTDEIRTSSGVSCRTSVGGNLQLHGGVVSSGNDREGGYYGSERDNEQGVYLGFSYSFGANERIRCDRLAEIETQKAEIELQQLKDQIKNLKKLQRLEMLNSGLLPR